MKYYVKDILPACEAGIEYLQQKLTKKKNEIQVILDKQEAMIKEYTSKGRKKFFFFGPLVYCSRKSAISNLRLPGMMDLGNYKVKSFSFVSMEKDLSSLKNDIASIQFLYKRVLFCVKENYPPAVELSSWEFSMISDFFEHKDMALNKADE